MHLSAQLHSSLCTFVNPNEENCVNFAAVGNQNKTFSFLLQYQFKLCLATASLGVSGALKTDDKKLELWVNGRTEIYTLEAKNKQAKESFAAELRKVVIRQKEIQRSLDQRTTNAVQQQVNILKILITTSPNTPYFISRLIFFEKVQTLIEVCLKHKSVNAFKLILPLNIFWDKRENSTLGDFLFYLALILFFWASLLRESVCCFVYMV